MAIDERVTPRLVNFAPLPSDPREVTREQRELLFKGDKRVIRDLLKLAREIAQETPREV